MGEEIKQPFETFEHGADIGVRGRGRTIEEAFSNAARAMFSLMVEDLETVRPLRTIRVTCQSYDREGLLTAWLNALIAGASIEGLLLRDFSLVITGLTASGTASGEPFNPVRHRPGVEVKGATFTELDVAEREGIWIAQCVVDV